MVSEEKKSFNSSIKHKILGYPYVGPTLRFARRRWKLLTILIAVGLPVFAIAHFIISEPEPEYLTEDVKRGELVQTVEVVATVISEKDLELKFPVSGIVEDLLVSDGDIVTAGQELARLRSGSLQAAVTAARAKRTTAYAELRALEEGTRPEDIVIAEAELNNKKSSLDLAQSKFDSAVAALANANAKLEALKREADTSSAGQVVTAKSTIFKEVSIAKTAIGVVEDVFEEVTLQNILVQQQPATYAQLDSQRKTLFNAINIALDAPATVSDYRSAIAALKLSSDYLSDVADLLQFAYDFISDQEPLGLFDYTKKESLKNTLAAQKAKVNTSFDNLNTTLKSLQDTVASFETKIATEEANVTTAQNNREQALIDINTFRTSVDIAQAQLDLKKAGTRKADIDAARGRAQSAQAEFERAQADFNDTVLLAPIDGTITKVNLKKGEFTPGQFSETVAAITILGISPYRIEVFTSEIDIPKVKYGQTGSLLLDAYPEREFLLTVTEIDPAATTVDGVPKYRIKLDFIENVDDLLKIGMTGDLDIITGSKDDVLYVPGRAVLKNDEGEEFVRILQENGELEQRTVTVGMETITNVEIVDGVEEGETVIVLIK